MSQHAEQYNAATCDLTRDGRLEIKNKHWGVIREIGEGYETQQVQARRWRRTACMPETDVPWPRHFADDDKLQQRLAHVGRRFHRALYGVGFRLLWTEQ